MQGGLKEEESTAMLYNRRSNFDFQLRMTMGLVVGSFIMMLKVLPRMEAAGRGDEKALVFFTITDTFALFAATMVAMTFLTGCHKSPKVEHLIRIILCCATLSLIYAVLSVAYMQLLPTTQWIVLCVGGVPATVLALLLLYHLLNTFPKQQEDGDFKLPM